MMKKIRAFFKKYFVRVKKEPIYVPVCEGELLKGKVSLIVGGTGGIGFGIAQRFVANGAKVILAGTNEEKLTALCNELGASARTICIDTTRISEIEDKLVQAWQMFGTIDSLVYASGVHCPHKFGQVTESDWNSVFDINVKGMYFTCQAFSNLLIEKKQAGHILTIGSASCAKPGWTAYEISKAAVRSMTLGMADKLISHGIVVNSIAPGPVATKMLHRENGDDLSWPGNPSGRMATPAEIGNLAVQMVSNMGDLIVGDTYFLSGGSGTICIDK